MRPNCIRELTLGPRRVTANEYEWFGTAPSLWINKQPLANQNRMIGTCKTGFWAILMKQVDWA